tara:strand:+ start:367 stop:1665 length:1299 start_codon:yes stop_codon:yes gene_type:complete
MDLKYTNKLFILFSTIPFFLIFGPAIPELIISIIIIFFFKNNYSLKKMKKYFDKIFISFSAFFIYIFLCSLTNFFNDKIDLILLLKSFFLIRFVFFYISIKWLSENINSNQIKYFIYIFFATILFVIIDLVIQYFFGHDILGYEAFVPGTPTAYRLTGPFGDELIPGSYLMKFGLIFSYFFFILFNINEKKYLPFLFILLTISIFITGERAAFVLFVFGSFLVLLFKRYYLSILSLTILLLFSLFITISFDENLKKRMLNYTFYQLNLNSYFDLNGNKNEKNNSFIDNPYGAHYETAYNIFKDNVIFGAGYKQFRKECLDEKYFHIAKSKLREVRCSTHPHNIFLEILSETGIVGFILFLIIIKTIFFEILKSQKINYYLFFQITLIFFPFISSGSIFTNKNLIYIFFILSLSFIFTKKNFFNKDLNIEFSK